VIRLSSADTATTDADGAEATEVDERREALLATLTGALGDAVVGSHIKPGQALWVRVTAEAWADAGAAAKQELGCKFFDFLSAIDWMPSPFGRYEDAEIDAGARIAEKVAAARSAPLLQGVAGGETRFQLLARVANVQEHHDVLLKADVPETLTMPTWTHLYAGANWHEREVREMFGIDFEGHPDPRNIYLPADFEGFPLRKDFPLLSRIVKPWPGVVDVEPMPGEPAGEGDDAAAEGGDE
jgi:NADH-quinone oxidoreductase subunit C